MNDIHKDCIPKDEVRNHVEVLQTILLPMAKGYAAEHDVGRNQEMVHHAEKVFSALLSPEAKGEGTMNYERLSHFHCWQNKGLPPCGQLIKDHKQCCLCDLKPARVEPKRNQDIKEIG